MTNSLKAVLLFCVAGVCSPSTAPRPASGSESTTTSPANANTTLTMSPFSLTEQAQVCNFLNPKDIGALYGANTQNKEDIQVLIDQRAKNAKSARTMDEFLHWATLANIDLGTPINKITLRALIEKLAEFISVTKLANDQSPFSEHDLSQVASLLTRGRRTQEELHALSENNHLSTVVTLFMFGCTAKDALDGLEQLQLAVNSFVSKSGDDVSEKLRDLALLIERSLCSTEGPEVIRNKSKSLHVAAKYGYMEFVELLLKKGADVNMKDPHHRIPLHLAAIHGSAAVVQLLLENRAEVDATENAGRASLHLAAMHGRAEVVQLLLENRAEVDARNDCKRTPLYLAVETGCIEVTRLLLENRAQVDAADNRGRTCLHISCISGHEEVVRLLLEREDVVDTRDQFGRTPLHCAATRRDESIVKLLLEKKADIHATDNNGKTPVHHAAEYGHVETVKALLDRGADHTVKNNKGQTPEMLACAKGYADVVAILDWYAAAKK